MVFGRNGYSTSLAAIGTISETPFLGGGAADADPRCTDLLRVRDCVRCAWVLSIFFFIILLKVSDDYNSV